MADDIISLRHSYALSMVERISELEAEIERLRAAGDALAEECWNLRSADDAVKAWRDARRG